MLDVVGRGPEIARIERWFREDGPATLLLEGPPGLGKTTVWSAAVDGLRASGAYVLSSVPTEAESRLSYSGLADLLAADLDEVRARLPAPQARALAVALRMEDPAGRPADETAVTRGALEAFRAIATLRGRLLLAIDDLRWLDGPSLATVVYVARRLEPHDRVRILATHRTGAPEPAGLDRAAAIERMTLGSDQRRRDPSHRAVSTPASRCPRPRLLEIHAVTLGNPLHAIELARADRRRAGPRRRVAGEPVQGPDRRPPRPVASGAGAHRCIRRPFDRTTRGGVGRTIRRRVSLTRSGPRSVADLVMVVAVTGATGPPAGDPRRLRRRRPASAPGPAPGTRRDRHRRRGARPPPGSRRWTAQTLERRI